MGVGEGGRPRLVGRVQARESLSGGAGRVAHALSSAISQWTQAREKGHSALAFRRPSFLGYETAQDAEWPTACPAVPGRLRDGRGLVPVPLGAARCGMVVAGDISILIEMDDAAAYERFLLDSEVRKYLGQLYGAWDLKTAGQSFHREVTPELIRALR